MAGKLITWIDPLSGTMVITIPAYADLARSPTTSDEDILSAAISKAVPQGVDYHRVDRDLLEAAVELCGDDFRDSWLCDEAGLPVVDMDAARDVHMGRIRAARDSRLAALDSEHFKALESGSDDRLAAISSEKQRLRNLPQTLSLNVETPAQLSAIWPVGLARD